MKNMILFLMVCFMSHFIYANDVMTLNNQMSFEGKVIKIKGCEVYFKTSDGERYRIPAHDIYCVAFADVNDPVYVSYMELLDTDPDKCLLGALDAQKFHGKGGVHVLLGFLFGPAAVIGAALANPTPYKGNTTLEMSQNKDYYQDRAYLDCYKRKARARNVGNTFVGWGAWVMVVLFATI